MTTWPADRAACFGVACHIHGSCARYQAIDHNDNQQQVFIDNCGPEHSAYIAVVPVAAEEKEV